MEIYPRWYQFVQVLWRTFGFQIFLTIQRAGLDEAGRVWVARCD